MPKMHLRQPGFTYSACGWFTKNKERIQRFKKKKKKKKAEDSRYIYQNQLYKACFQHDMAYGDFKDFTRRTTSDKILSDKAFNIAKNKENNEYQRGIASMVYNFFDEKTSGSGIKNENISNKELTEELDKPIVRNFNIKKCNHLSLTTFGAQICN